MVSSTHSNDEERKGGSYYPWLINVSKTWAAMKPDPPVSNTRGIFGSVTLRFAAANQGSYDRFSGSKFKMALLKCLLFVDFFRRREP